MVFKKSVLIFLLLLTMGFSHAFSKSSATVKASIDSVNLLMGNLMTLHLEVVENEGVRGNFVIFQDADKARGYSTVCGDSVELRTSYSIDTTELGSGKIQLNYEVPIQAFDSGTYTIPSLAYVKGADTVYSNKLTFNVIPVSANADDPIAGFAGVEEPDGKSFFDWVPDWLIDFWWIWLIILLAICASLWAMKNYKSKGGIAKLLSKPLPTPWDSALSQLKALKERKLWEQGMDKEYFTQLTDILRVYLFERFGINAMEMTTRQILEIVFQSDLKDKKDYIRQILNVADFVKFAKVRPLPADSIAAYENAVRFINETIPVSDESKDMDENEKSKGGEEE